MTRIVGIYIFNDMEVLDFAGPFEVFSTASRVYQRSHPGSTRLFDVTLIASGSVSVEARGGLRILPDWELSDSPKLDILVVPGGVVDQELEHDVLMDWIRKQRDTAEMIASVCTGSFILAKAGLLHDSPATTHWEDLEAFSMMFPTVKTIKESRWVEHGGIITSAGISAGIDMSLHLVSRLVGKDLAELTARQMDYRWQENP